VVLQDSKPNPPEPEKKQTATAEEEEMDWDDDPENPRNWPWGKKWRVVSVVNIIHTLSPSLVLPSILTDDYQVSMYTFCSPLASSMMAPGLPEVGLKYGISSPTLIALTLSIFLFSFAIGVCDCRSSAKY
jgi:hypothetical protein